MFYCKMHAEKNGWPWPEHEEMQFTIPPLSHGPCEVCSDKKPKLCADVPSSYLPIPKGA
jgi:hypothetical protein